jgi:superfamily I DNA/RNA helicase
LWKKGKDYTVIRKDTKIHIENGKIYLTTFHSAKGLEFDHVFIPRLTSEKLPDPDIINSATSTESALSDELKLLYVAVTRSKYGLYMTYSGTLSELFPSNSTNYIRHEKE